MARPPAYAEMGGADLFICDLCAEDDCPYQLGTSSSFQTPNPCWEPGLVESQWEITMTPPNRTQD